VDLEVTETMLDAVSVKEKGPIFIVGSTCKVASHTVRYSALRYVLLTPDSLFHLLLPLLLVVLLLSVANLFTLTRTKAIGLEPPPG
jgi:hypothetical protein